MAAPNLFKVAKEKGATAASKKPSKTEVLILEPEFHADLSRLAELGTEMDRLKAEADSLSAGVKARGIKEFTRLYEHNGKYPGSFNIKAQGMPGTPPASLMFIPTDKYLKIDEKRFNQLVDTYGTKIALEKTTYTMDADLVAQYGEIISDLITNARGIPDTDKAKLIQATVAYEVAKGTISDIQQFEGTISEVLEDVKPIYQLKNIHIEGEDA